MPVGHNEWEDSDIVQEGGEGTPVESNLSDSTLDHPEPPTERDSTDESENELSNEGNSENADADDDDEETELTDENNDTERATRPSERTSGSISSKDPADLRQGRLSETATEESDTENDDSGSES